MDWKHALKASSGKGHATQPAGARAPLMEVFDSIQGEGRWVGTRMVFARVATCPLRCLYCDTTASYQAPAQAAIRMGVRDATEPNPVSALRAAALIKQVAQGTPQPGRALRVSLTGGEPLTFPEFVRELGQALRDQGMRLHLETAAVDPEALAICMAQIDHLSADWKLPETLGPAAQPNYALQPGETYAARHLRCLDLALRRGSTVDVKIVLTPAVGDASLDAALQALAPLREKLLLVLQPVTPCLSVTRPLPRADLQRHVDAALRLGFDVRVLPQVHKQLQVP